ncbi:MAG: hypothetical protein A2087_09105 [Spirochaetes bacterium GWD1_61_31]|nr:MAG: hypothetical protein A2Y37_02115 [Spirochaetes bacterium GWB1_60_80]OHD35259.1 MAG: hypothetical protein A2004_13380 [Spirochaetes bacterium GWC1_61_12]OHD36014.1 MAG: hypothetical protein A2087_09105 [Spirochaetes bacterium GWD1_61_31]OHD57983.1 MAG: hypothetical protein A2Y32_14265 [Spirochaetes bacterium GWF1_60_12]HAW85555.1 hypothetical protein [Spirochaetaceae bacterium]
MKLLCPALVLCCFLPGMVAAQAPAVADPATRQAAERNFILAALDAAGSEELPLPSELPETMHDEAIALIILAVVPGALPDGWMAKEFRYTIPGTAVSVRMIGADVVVVISVTPYRSSGDQFMLVAQAQVWIKDAQGVVHYRTTFDTIQVAAGERVFFYPLGMNQEGAAPLRVELLVNSFRALEAAWTNLVAERTAEPAGSSSP